jgi:methyl-accepting chemotaxis protein
MSRKKLNRYCSLAGSSGKIQQTLEQSKISKIIEIINEISSKTHILSINASIVSARAGKDGKAFDVVSKEIRKLAIETEKSLKQIEDEINKIQEIIKYVVNGINDANAQTMKERDMLSAVIGALQGVTLGVEVLRAVSNVVNTKTIQQKELMESIFHDYQQILKNINSFSAIENNPVEN